MFLLFAITEVNLVKRCWILICMFYNMDERSETLDHWKWFLCKRSWLLLASHLFDNNLSQIKISTHPYIKWNPDLIFNNVNFQMKIFLLKSGKSLLSKSARQMDQGVLLLRSMQRNALSRVMMTKFEEAI